MLMAAGCSAIAWPSRFTMSVQVRLVPMFTAFIPGHTP
jgi:hypothetical protein